MSAGQYVNTRYQASYLSGDQIHPIRVQPETILAAIGGVDNAPPAGGITNPIQARVNGGRRTIGLVARSVSLRFPAAGAPAGYAPGGVTRIPALTTAFYNAAVNGAEVTYLGVTCVVVGRSGELPD